MANAPSPFNFLAGWEGPKFLQTFGFQWPTFGDSGGGPFRSMLPNISLPEPNFQNLPLGLLQARGPQGYDLPLLQPHNQPNKFLPTLGSQPKAPASGATTSTSSNVQKFDPQLRQVSSESGVPYDVLAALMSIENGNGDPSIVRSDTGAAGLMQVVGGPTEPLENIRAAAKLLRSKQQAFSIAPDDWESTAAAYFGAYNGGVTGARDATGTSGYDYVGKFRAARSQYMGGDDLAARVKPLLGQGYVWGGKSPQTGFDCSGFAGYLHGNPNESTTTLWSKSQPIDSSSLQPGDMVFLNMDQSDMTLQHVATYIGNGQFAEAGGAAHNVNIATLDQIQRSVGTISGYRRM